jgi:hypothetical protein
MTGSKSKDLVRRADLLALKHFNKRSHDLKGKTSHLISK